MPSWIALGSSRACNRRAMFVVAALCTGVAPRAQHAPLTPTSDTSIVVTGVLRYSSIHVPANVTVDFIAPGWGPAAVPGIPAVVIVDGDVVVGGTLSLAGDQAGDRAAGFVTTGEGVAGSACGTVYTPATGGRHASAYGTVLPFSLEGGSPGGALAVYSDPGCSQYLGRHEGGEPGGTLVLLVGGRIEIGGNVTADAYHGPGGGSGGSLLLRAEGGVIVHPGGTVSARRGIGASPPPPWPPLMCFGDDGYVRLDAWGSAPDLQGTITPAPTVLELPHLRALSPPQIGATWALDVFAPEATPIFVAVSLAPGSGTPTPFGPLGLDLATAAPLALAIAGSGHDPVANVPWPIPNAPAIVGLPLWLQALAVPPALPARLTNTLAVTVQ